MTFKRLMEYTKNGLKNKAERTILDPLNQMTDDTLKDITTTIGSFAIRSIRGKFQRSISFTINSANFRNSWMEDALYSILYKYNDLKKANKLEFTNSREFGNSDGVYYRLEPGFHNLKYRNYNILLMITNDSSSVSMKSGGRIIKNYTYTIITYNLDPKFVTYFEQDMLDRRNSMFELNKDSKTISIWSEEDDESTYLSKFSTIPKRKLDTLYLPTDVKNKLVNTINMFIASKKIYQEHGIPWNLKILLHGLPGTGKSSIEKVIASEWNRTLIYLKGAKGGKYIPDMLTTIGNDQELSDPLIVIADIDKHPALINDTEIDNNDEKANERKAENKQLFGKMINALDGVMSGENKIIIMDTNHIDKFSPTFLRPGRVDLILEIPPVRPEVFRKYIFDHYQKELPKDIKLKDKNLTIPSIQFDVLFSKMSFEEICKKYLK